MVCQSSSMTKFPKIDKAFSFYPFVLTVFLIFIITIIERIEKKYIDFIDKDIKTALTGSHSLLGPLLISLVNTLDNSIKLLT